MTHRNAKRPFAFSPRNINPTDWADTVKIEFAELIAKPTRNGVATFRIVKMR